MHHCISIIASLGSLSCGGFNINVAAATLFTEISTIFLHIRFYMIKKKVATGNKFLAVMGMFIILFFYSRIYLQTKMALRFFEFSEAAFAIIKEKRA